MGDRVRTTNLKELTGDLPVSGKQKSASRVRSAPVPAATAFSSVRTAGSGYRKGRKAELKDIDGIPSDITDSLAELDGLIDRMDSYGAFDSFDEEIRYNECYFDACRAHELVAGINHRLNRLVTKDKHQTEKSRGRHKQIESLYGLTGVLEERLNTFMDSMEKEHGFTPSGMTKGMNDPVLRPGAED